MNVCCIIACIQSRMRWNDPKMLDRHADMRAIYFMHTANHVEIERWKKNVTMNFMLCILPSSLFAYILEVFILNVSIPNCKLWWNDRQKCDNFVEFLIYCRNEFYSVFKYENIFMLKIWIGLLHYKCSEFSFK